MKRSTCLFFLEKYSVILIISTQSSLHTAIEYNDENCRPFLMSNVGVISELLTKCAKNVAVMADEEVRAASANLVNTGNGG